MKASPELIAEAGRLLFGSHWQSDLAEALEVSRRAVQRWHVGVDEPRPSVWTDLANLVDARISELRRMRTAIAAQTKGNDCCLKAPPAKLSAKQLPTYKTAPTTMVDTTQRASGHRIPHYPDEYLYKELGLYALPLRRADLPSAKA